MIKNAEKQLYERLHFYLPTKLQVVDTTTVNILHADRHTPLDQVYLVPQNPWLTKAKEKKILMNDGDKKPAAK